MGENESGKFVLVARSEPVGEMEVNRNNVIEVLEKLQEMQKEDMFDDTVEKIESLMKIIVMSVLVVFLIVCTVKVVHADTYTCVVHRGEWVWIRAEPSPKARQIGRVRYGYEIESGEPINGYLAIDPKPGWMLDGEIVRRGYVDASYFDRSIPETMYRVNTAGGPLAKRETPNGRLLCWIKPGVKISVLGWRYDKNGEIWAKVFHGGYVKAEYLANPVDL